MTGLRAVWYGIVDAYSELFPVVGMNVLWFVFTVPLAFVVTGVAYFGAGAISSTPEARDALVPPLLLVGGFVLVLGPNPAGSGIHLWANRLVKEERVEFALFWEGLRENLWRALKLMGVSYLGLVILITNAAFYLASESTPLKVFGIVWVYAIYFWLSMQIYLMPLLIEQEDKRMRLVLRNAFFLSLANFLPTLILVVVGTALFVLSVGVPLLILLVTGSVFALMQARQLSMLLERHRPAPAREPES